MQGSMLNMKNSLYGILEAATVSVSCVVGY